MLNVLHKLTFPLMVLGYSSLVVVEPLFEVVVGFGSLWPALQPKDPKCEARITCPLWNARISKGQEAGVNRLVQSRYLSLVRSHQPAKSDSNVNPP